MEVAGKRSGNVPIPLSDPLTQFLLGLADPYDHTTNSEGIDGGVPRLSIGHTLELD